MLIDTHAHLFWDSYKEDFDDVIDRALEAGLDTIINVGVDLETSEIALNLKSDKIHFFSSIGIHPHEAHKYFSDPDVSIQNDIERAEDLYRRNHSTLRPRSGRANSGFTIVAVGECGLDYAFPHFAEASRGKDLQKKLFMAQVELAKKLGLPLLIHCRNAWSDIFEKLAGTKGLFHTFTGSKTDAQEALDLGYYLSFSGMITYPKNEYLREIVKQAPLDRILTETDCPFLPPQSRRGQRNEPANVKEVVRLISELKEIPFKEAADQIYQNFKKLFMT